MPDHLTLFFEHSRLSRLALSGKQRAFHRRAAQRHLKNFLEPWRDLTAAVKSMGAALSSLKVNLSDGDDAESSLPISCHNTLQTGAKLCQMRISARSLSGS